MILSPLSGKITGQKNVTEAVAEALGKNCKRLSIGGEGLSFRETLNELRTSLLDLVFHTSNIEAVYMTPSRSTKGMLRDLLPFACAKMVSKRVICHWHGGELKHISKTTFWRQLFRFIYGRSEHVVLSAGMKADLDRILGQNNSKVVHNFFDLGDVSFPLEAKKKVSRVGFLSNLVPGKGLEDFCWLAQEFNKDVAFLVGGSELKPGYVSSVQSREACEFLGHLELASKCQFLREIDLLVFPSIYRSEAFPLVILEAKAMGCEVLCYDSGYIKDLHKELDLHIVEDRVALKSSFAQLCTKEYSPASNAEMVKNFSKSVFQEKMLLEIFRLDEAQSGV